MPASITLSALRHDRPDATPIFGPLDLVIGPGLTGLVGRNGAGKSTLIDILAGQIAPSAGHAVCSSAPRVLAQASERVPGATIATLFGIAPALDLLGAALRGEAEDMDRVDWTLEERLAAALARAGLPPLPPDTPLAQLSGGQVRRAALAALVFDAPEILLLDEPTNDLDDGGRQMAHALLAGHRGIALVASHDRALLNHADRIVELSPTGLRVTGGGWQAHEAAREAERTRAAAELSAARSDLRDTRARAEEAEARRARRARLGRRARADGSQPKILLDAKQDSAEARAAGAARLADRQAKAARARLEAAEAGVDRGRDPVFALPACKLPAGRHVLEMTGVTLTRPGTETPVLSGMDLEITGPERIALTGANGAGKSTLLALMSGDLAPTEGLLRRPVPAARLDQRLKLLDGAATPLDALRRNDPAGREGDHRARLARFLFRAEAVERSLSDFSGGERLRLALACVLGRSQPPQLLMLDEPTNHLDIAALEAVEVALRDYDGALVVVSHDAAFLDALSLTRRIRVENGRVSG